MNQFFVNSNIKYAAKQTATQTHSVTSDPVVTIGQKEDDNSRET